MSWSRNSLRVLAFAVTAVAVRFSAADCQSTSQGTVRSVQVSAGERAPELERLRRQHDSLSRILDALPLAAIERARVADQLVQVGRQIAALNGSARSASGSPPNLGIVITRDIRETLERSRDAGRVALEGAMPGGMLGFTATGLMYQEIRPNGMYIRYYDYPVIELVDPNTPADSAGISVGDRLIAYDGLNVLMHEINLSQLLEPERRVRVLVDRGGDVRDFSLVVMPATDAVRKRRTDLVSTLMGPEPHFGPAADVRIGRSLLERSGMQLLDLNPQLATTFGVAEGVLVVMAPPGSPAFEWGLRGGDVIVRIARSRVGSMAELTRLLDGQRGPKVLFETLRDGRVREIEIPVR